MVATINIRTSCVIFSICIIVLGATVVACANKNEDDRGGEKKMPAKTIEQALKDYTTELMSLSDVVGTAQGLCDGQPCIKVFVVKETPELEQKIRHILEGYPVVIEETGRIRPRPEKP